MITITQLANVLYTYVANLNFGGATGQGATGDFAKMYNQSTAALEAVARNKGFQITPEMKAQGSLYKGVVNGDPRLIGSNRISLPLAGVTAPNNLNACFTGNDYSLTTLWYDMCPLVIEDDGCHNDTQCVLPRGNYSNRSAYSFTFGCKGKFHTVTFSDNCDRQLQSIDDLLSYNLGQLVGGLDQLVNKRILKHIATGAGGNQYVTNIGNIQVLGSGAGSVTNIPVVLFEQDYIYNLVSYMQGVAAAHGFALQDAILFAEPDLASRFNVLSLKAANSGNEALRSALATLPTIVTDNSGTLPRGYFYLVAPNAIRFTSYNLYQPELLEDRAVREALTYKGRVPSLAVPNFVVYDLQFDTVCENGVNIYTLGVRQNVDSILNPLRCNHDYTGIIKFKVDCDLSYSICSQPNPCANVSFDATWPTQVGDDIILPQNPYTNVVGGSVVGGTFVVSQDNSTGNEIVYDYAAFTAGAVTLPPLNVGTYTFTLTLQIQTPSGVVCTITRKMTDISIICKP